MQNIPSRYSYALLAAILILTTTPMAYAHEAWFITSSEIDVIIAKPPPRIFQSYGLFSIFTLSLLALFVFGIYRESKWRQRELEILAPLRKNIRAISGLSLSLSLAIMMLIAAFGLLPVMGTEGGKTSLFVANTILDQNTWWSSAIMASQIVLAIMLIYGFQTRLAAVGVIALAACGHIIFGWQFIDFSLHFIAPALILLASGQGTRLFFVERRDCLLKDITKYLSFEQAYQLARILTGLGFVLLAINYKILKPGLVLEMLDMTILPDLGQHTESIALLMALIELFAGLSIMLGVLVRPISLFLLFAFTFFTLVLNEAVFYHTQLYALAFVFFVGGANPEENLTTQPVDDRRLRPWSNSFKFAHSGIFAGIALFLILAVPPYSQKAAELGSPFELTEITPRPAVNLVATRDQTSNWWLQIEAEHFEFSEKLPESCRDQMCGHFHILIDGKKMTKAMQPIVLLGKLTPGQHQIEALMLTADHRPVQMEGQPIAARLDMRIDQKISQDISAIQLRTE